MIQTVKGMELSQNGCGTFSNAGKGLVSALNQDLVLDHVTIAVKDLEKSKQIFTLLFRAEFITEVERPEQNAIAAYYRLGDIIIGLETYLSEEGDIYNFLKKRGEGIHHLAFRVESLDKWEEQLKEQDIQVIAHSEQTGIKKEFFTHPKSSLGILLQFMEWEEPYQTSLQKRMENLHE